MRARQKPQQKYVYSCKLVSNIRNSLLTIIRGVPASTTTKTSTTEGGCTYAGSLPGEMLHDRSTRTHEMQML